MNNPLFFIKYKINYKCSGYCQYKNGGFKNWQSPPYIDIKENNLENRHNKTLNDILVNEIYENKSKLCELKDCILNENNILNIKYEFLELQLILSFHISFLNYEELKSHLDIINYTSKMIFSSKISIII